MRENPHNTLLVEGRDEMHVVHHLSNYAGIMRGSFDTIPKNGYSELLESLEVHLLESDLQRLGVVVDADYDLDARWTSLRNRLISSGYSSLPEFPQPAGIVILQHDKPKLGVWLWPNNSLPGILEDFVSYLVPDNDYLWTYACQAVDSIPMENRRFKNSYLPKVYIHTWLAWQEEPGTPLGQAITKRYLDASLPDAQKFIEWLKRLFDLE
jgi:hypothetical protein